MNVLDCYYLFMTGWCLWLAAARLDWQWLCVAALLAVRPVVALIRRPGFPEMQPASVLGYCPAWMRWRAGQWLSPRVPFVGRLWRRNMDAAVILEQDVQATYYRLRLLVALNAWAYSTEALPQPPGGLAQVMAAWAAWRSAAEQLHRLHERAAGGERLELPMWLHGMPRMEDLWSADTSVRTPH